MNDQAGQTGDLKRADFFLNVIELITVSVTEFNQVIDEIFTLPFDTGLIKITEGVSPFRSSAYIPLARTVFANRIPLVSNSADAPNP